LKLIFIFACACFFKFLFQISFLFSIGNSAL
jgi:hypothetical protein